MELDLDLLVRIKKKGMKGTSRCKVVAIAYDKKGDILGMSVNTRNTMRIGSKYGTGLHAERILIAQYGKNISRIVIARFGRAGANRPIDPCPVCKKVADKLGIKIQSVEF